MGILDFNQNQTTGALAGNLAGRVLFPEVPFAGNIGAFLGGGIGRLFGGGSSNRNIFLPALNIPANLSGIEGGAIFADSFRDFGPQLVSQQLSIRAQDRIIQKELSDRGFKAEAEELNRIMDVLAHTTSPADAAAKAQEQVNILSRYKIGLGNLIKEQDKLFKENPDLKLLLDAEIKKNPDVGVSQLSGQLFSQLRNVSTQLSEFNRGVENNQIGQLLPKYDPSQPEKKYPNIPIDSFLKLLIPKQNIPIPEFKFQSTVPDAGELGIDFFNKLAVKNVLGGQSFAFDNFAPQNTKGITSRVGLPFEPTGGNLFLSKQKPLSGLAFLS